MLRTNRAIALFIASLLTAGQGGAFAQGSDSPAELPPTSYAANEYVDSQGCVYIRAGIGGSVTWVPRVSRERRAVCGQSPSLAPTAQTAATPTQVSPRRRPAEAAPLPTAPAAAPALRTTTVPTRKRSSVRAAPTTYRTAEASLPHRSNRIDLPPEPPRGYRRVFTDGRHNPHRGQGTAAGRAQMRTIWTDDVPARLVTEQPAQQPRASRPARREPRAHDYTTVTVHVSSKAAATATTARSAHRYVQVGAFANPSNVRTAISRLQRAGLPVSTTTARGRKVVLAGPFTTRAQIRRALAAAHRVGFADAFPR